MYKCACTFRYGFSDVHAYSTKFSSSRTWQSYFHPCSKRVTIGQSRSTTYCTCDQESLLRRYITNTNSLTCARAVEYIPATALWDAMFTVLICFRSPAVQSLQSQEGPREQNGYQKNGRSTSNKGQTCPKRAPDMRYLTPGNDKMRQVTVCRRSSREGIGCAWL